MPTAVADRTARLFRELFLLALLAGLLLAIPWQLDLLSRLFGR